MDLGTVKKKLSDKKYTTLYQVAEDVRLVWNNCMTYNADGSDFYKLAEQLQKKWDDKYTKLLQDCQLPANAAGADGKKTVTGSDKRLFAKALYQISKEDLGKVLVEVETKCPAAIVRSSAEDELELNIDKIQSSLLQELTTFVNTVKSTKKKKAAPGASAKRQTS
jgi:hypothetical protein